MSERTTYFSYHGLSHFEHPNPDQRTPQTLRLFTDSARPIEIRIKVKKKCIPAIRESFNALMLVLEPGFEYRPSKGTKGVINYDKRAENKAKARNYFCATIKKNDPDSTLGMDPTVSISPKGILIEGLSLNGQDMSSIFIPSTSYDVVVGSNVVYGTSTVETGPDLLDGLLQISSKKDFEIHLGSVHGEPSTYAAPYFGAVKKDFVYPTNWKRDNLQFLAASFLEKNIKVRLKRIDVYNVLRHLRLNKTEKEDNKALNFILIKGLDPQIQLEPWGFNITSPVGKYQGDRSAFIKFYGRDKLKRIEPLLPFIDHVDVNIMEEALPVFWVLNSPEVSYTYATLGYSTDNWARGLYRDQVLRRDTENPTEFDTVMSYLKTQRHASFEEIVASTGKTPSDVRSSLLRGIQIGEVAPNAGIDGFQYREIFMETSIHSLVYGSSRDNGYKEESRAYQIVDQNRVNLNGKITVSPTGEIDFASLTIRRKKEIVKDRENERIETELEYVTSPVEVSQEKLVFQKEDPIFYPKLQLNVLGATRKPGCTCSYMDAKKDTPNPICSHIQALWIHYCRNYLLNDSNKSKNLDQRILIKVTDDGKNHAHRLRIRSRRLIDESGTLDQINSGTPNRRVRMFHREEDAYQAFLARITELEQQDFTNAG